MACHACWLNDLGKVPCLQEHNGFIPVNIPMVVTLRCYVVMTKSWLRPGGKIILTSHIDDVPFGHVDSAITFFNLDKLMLHFRPATSDLGELKKIVDAAVEIWPREVPWLASVKMPRVIELNRDITIEHAPFVADDGRGREMYEKDMEWVGQYGPTRGIFSWDEWFRLREETVRELNDVKRKKSDQRT